MNQLVIVSIPAFITLLGVVFVAIYNPRKSRSITVTDEQLHKLYAPLFGCIHQAMQQDFQTLSPTEVTSCLTRCEVIIYKNYILVPPHLIDLLKQAKRDLDQSSFETFCSTICANLNYCRRMLGYPCEGVFNSYRFLDKRAKLDFWSPAFALVWIAIFAGFLIFISSSILIFVNTRDVSYLIGVLPSIFLCAILVIPNFLSRYRQ